MRNSLKQLVLGSVLATLAFASVAEAQTVKTMPNRQVRPGQSLQVFGSVNDGSAVGVGLPYSWSFSSNPDVTVTTDGNLSGLVTSTRFVVENVTFSLDNGSTREVITATLDVNGVQASMQIDIVDPSDPISDTALENLQLEVNIAIEDGLRAMYLSQNANGSWTGEGGGIIRTCGTTAFSVWAFSNSGHRPTSNTIYSPWVQAAVTHILNGSFFGPVAGGQGSLGGASPDLDGNNRIVNLCPASASHFGGGHPESPGYASPIATAALVAAYSANPLFPVPGVKYNGEAIREVIEDSFEWVALAQNDNPVGDFRRGGWRYQVNDPAPDTSSDSWNYVAAEGWEAVMKGSVPEEFKRSAENRINGSQNPNAGANYGQFGYTNTFVPIHGLTSAGNAVTAGGLSGLVMVSQQLANVGMPPVPTVVPRTGFYLDPGGSQMNTFGSIANRKTAAVGLLGQNWHRTNVCPPTGQDPEGNCEWDGNRANFYAMWTTARALRLNGTSELVNGGVTFNWETGETQPAGGNVPGAGDPREGYFNFLVRTQNANGSWNGNSVNGNWTMNLHNAWGILILQPKVFPAPCEDSDNDGDCDTADNCVDVANSGQEDVDGDGAGDACDTCPNDAEDDADGDGVCGDVDACPGFDDNLDQDGDGLADGCDVCPQDPGNDDDGDSVCAADDNCATDPNPDQADADVDGLGDACDACPLDAANDADGDGVCETADNCDTTANGDQTDGDGDGQGDACDACPLDTANDADGDGVCETADNCDTTANGEQTDGDGDGQGDACDACPLDAANDADGDGVCETADNCDTAANANQADADGDGVGDACDACANDAANDADGDGICGDVDNCPTANSNQADGDNDGQGDACDACPLDAANDADGDGVCETADNCDTTANANQTDSDNDGQGDACDACALDPLNDVDGDGVCGNVDNCPTVANSNQADSDGNGVGDACSTGQFPSGGAFVVGNLANLTGNSIVNFWGSQWVSNNPMSGGSGPNGFKGFETSSPAPACGSTWTTSAGSSSNPPATIPQFMTVIVSSNVTKSGSTISGNVQKVLIVETQPGYGPAPGQQGFGRVVAVVCSQ